MEKVIVAVPSNLPGGMDATVSQHFGHCDIYTLLEIQEDGTILNTSTIPNLAHEEGGCLGPVKLLADNGVSILIAGGMGRRPFMGFQEAGIYVYRGIPDSKVSETIELLVNNELPMFTMDSACGGGGGGCHSHE